ncbi:MAG: GerMN domain-containing protein [Lachnospiraceae bacterium]
MKKITILFLVLCLSILAGCQKRAGQEQETYQIYYLDRNNHHLSALEYEGEADREDTAAVAAELLEQLAATPKKAELSPAILGFSVLDYSLKEEQITLNLSAEYKELEPIQEVLARAAMVKTLTQIKNLTYVTILVNGENLLDKSGTTIGVMSADNFIDNTGEEMKNYEETELVLYFSNSAGDGLVKINRRLMYNTNISKEKLVVEQLIKGPITQNGSSNTEAYATINPATQILSVNVKDGICYVNLDSNFLVSAYPVNADTVIYSLVNSLTELTGVIKVQLLVEGESKINYREKYDFSVPFEANPHLVQSAEAGGQEE